MRKILIIGLFLTSAATAFAQPAPPRSLSVRFGRHDATVTGITPGGQAVIFGIGLEPTGDFSLTFKWSGVADDTDKDGSVTVDFGRDVPGPTIWCFADATTADFKLATPGGAPVPLTLLRPGAFRKVGPLVAQFGFDRSVLDLLYIEPARGAWICTAADGGPTDRDGPNGFTVVSVEDFRGVGTTTGKPTALKPGGVLVAIDFVRLEAVAVRLDATLIGGAP